MLSDFGFYIILNENCIGWLHRGTGHAQGASALLLSQPEVCVTQSCFIRAAGLQLGSDGVRWL